VLAAGADPDLPAGNGLGELAVEAGSLELTVGIGRATMRATLASGDGAHVAAGVDTTWRATGNEPVTILLLTMSPPDVSPAAIGLTPGATLGLKLSP
jgi:hypothetical protein